MRDQLLRFRTEHPPKTFRVNGDDWFYRTSGAGAECVLFLPGGMTTGESYFEYISGLEDSFRLIAPDIPLTVDRVARAVAGLAGILDAESVSRVHLFGHSQGGMIAQAFVRAFAERTASMVLSNTCLPNATLAKKVGRRVPAVRHLPVTVFRFLLKRSLKRLLEADAPDMAPEQRAFWFDYLMETCAGGKLRQTALSFAQIQMDYHRNTAIGTAGLEDWPGRVLIFDSDGDTLITQEEFARLRAAYPGAFTHTFQGTGHLDFITRMESYLVRVKLFWRGAAVTARRTP